MCILPRCGQTFDVNCHKVIDFEEFNIDFCRESFLKRRLEERNYSYPVKSSLDEEFLIVQL